jgi:glycosyltransferase involved in cell wall biosynthesis
VALTAGRPSSGHRLDIPVLGRQAMGAATLRALRRAAGEADVVVAHGSRTLDACAVALAGSGTPFVYRSIGDPAAWSSRGVRRRRTALLLRRAARVAVLWPGAADTLRAAHGVPDRKIEVIPNGVAVDGRPAPDRAARVAARGRLGLPAEAPVAAYVGALSAEKRVDAAIDAVAGLPDVHLLVVGDGPQRSALEARAAGVTGGVTTASSTPGATTPSGTPASGTAASATAASATTSATTAAGATSATTAGGTEGAAVAGRVHFTGALPGPDDALAAADVVVLPSRTEGMPGVLIEAGLAARPCVATAVGGVASVIDDGVTGVLVPPDDATALAEALGTLLAAGPARLAEMGAAARARCAERFDMAVVTSAWADLLEAVAPPA